MGIASAAERDTQKSDNASSGRDRLGGARADFVANLGRRRAELRTTLDALRADPGSKRYRDELRRRFHALGAGAKLLKFTRLADELRVVELKLEEAAQRGSLEDGDFGAAHDLIGRITSLAWGQTEETEAPKPSPFANETKPRLREISGNVWSAPAARPPVSVLVVGQSSLADALNMPNGRLGEEDGHAFEVERTADPQVAIDIARALAPDVIVFDGDLPEGRAKIEAILGDPLTENIPVIVALKLGRTDEAGPFLALGVAKVLPKPVSPGELRRACAAAISSYVRREVSREPLGDLNLDQLGARLAEELRKSLCDTVQPDARSTALALGEGTEVLAALWGAVARIRDVVTIRSQGKVRFTLGGPEGAVPMAPWLESGDVGASQAKRSSTPRFAREGEATLEKTRILVADDDAAVCWFLAGVLKTAGATVFEARDGERALEIAKHVNPDLVISDILMPKLDGFGLSRALRRDVLLRDVPIVLLSWKEDLLQRVRELGAEADGYLRKEASAGAIVQRVRELVRARQRVAQRVATQGEVRGRLDGLTSYTLLRTVCQVRKSATVAVRDASHLYEIEIRDGKPIRATRTAMNGAFERGSAVLAALLGVGDGRFSVSQPREDEDVGPVRVELDGTLNDQLVPVIASARAAQRLLSGSNLMCVSRVEIDEDAATAYFEATPEPARSIVRAVINGISPRDLLSSGRASARLLEDVLLDASAHGAVIQVFDAQGEDRLPAATSLEIALLRGERSANPIVELPVITVPLATQPVSASAPLPVELPTHGDLLRAALKAPEPTHAPEASGPVIDAAGNVSPFLSLPRHVDPSVGQDEIAPIPGAATLEEVASKLGLEEDWFDGVGSVPSQGDSDEVDAAEEEASQYESPKPPSGPRLLTPPPATRTNASPMDSIVSTLAGFSEPKSPVSPVAAEPAKRPSSPRLLETRELTPTPSSLPPPPGLKPMLTLGSLHPPPVLEIDTKTQTPRPKNVKKSPAPPPVAQKEPREESRNELTPRFPRPSAFLAYNGGSPKKDRRAVYWFAFALVGVVFALWARWSRERTSEQAMIADIDKNAPAEIVSGQPVEGAAAPPPEATSEAIDPQKPRVDDSVPEELPLRDGDKLKKGYGLLEIVAGKSDTIYIDGKPVGSGPTVSLPMKAKPEPYQIRIKTRGDERSRFVAVKEGKLVRLRMAPPWQR